MKLTPFSRCALCAFLFIVLAALTSRLTPPTYAQGEAADGPRFVPGQVLIQFRAGTIPAQHRNARARAAAVRASLIRVAGVGKGDLELASLRGTQDVPAAIRALEADPAVLFAEPNWIYTHQSTSTDTDYTNGKLWGLYGDKTSPSNQYGSQAGEAWAGGSTGSNQVYVGIIDEGIQHTHPDLVANIWKNPFEKVDGVDEDGNGKIDDVNGWDFANNDRTIYDGTGDDHGTHVTGTIAAAANNSGVVGVNWNVTYISGKFLGSNGGTTDNAIRAIDYFTDLKKRHNLNIVATNNSWGGGGFSQALLDAITRGAKQNILFIAAAGNGDRFGRGLNNDSKANYPSNYDTTQGSSSEPPASYDAVIAVAAIDKNGAKASFSNYGANTVDLGAPGVDVFSTVPDGYASYNGTSMATPHVTGAVALYASARASASALEIKNAILDAARNTPTSSLSGKTVTNGRLNLSDVAPAGPGSLQFSAQAYRVNEGAGSVTVTVTRNGGSAGTVTVAYATSDGTANTDLSNGAVDYTSASGTLIFGDGVTTQTFVVEIADDALVENDKTVNLTLSNAGSATIGTPSAAVLTIVDNDQPLLAPSLTANATWNSQGNQINLAWNDNNSEDGFSIERSPDGIINPDGTTNFVEVATVGANVTNYSDTSGLSASTTYFYRVRARKGVTYSAYSNTASDTTATVDGSGTGLKGEYYDNAGVNVDFTNLKMTRTDARVNFDWGTGSPTKKMAADTFSVRWTGQVQPRFDGIYTFYTHTDDGVRLWVNGQLLINKWNDQALSEGEEAAPIILVAGQKYDIIMEYYENTSGAIAKLSWSSPNQAKELIPQSQLYPTISTTSAATTSTSISSVELSSASAQVAGQSVKLNFSGALDAGLASDPTQYTVAVNGNTVDVESASYSPGANVVTLRLAPGTLRANDLVGVSWFDLKDTNGAAINGQTVPLTAP